MARKQPQPKAKEQEPSEFSDYVDTAIESFELAARNYALRGGQHPLEWPYIDEQYKATKVALRKTILAYVDRRVKGLEDNEPGV